MIASLREEGERIAPVQMYRVLGALIQAGHVIKVESRHGYIAAQRAHAAGDPVALLVCACCGGVEEAPDAVAASVLAPISALRAFKPSSRAIEVLGACGNCQSEPTVMNSHAAPRE
jgi:Fe2+ or Zn2+ uptake regulation protein